MSSQPPMLWYFAYGSNMDPRTFLGRRSMRPAETRVARLDEWELRFDLPVGPGERGVANVRRNPGRCVWGVCYSIEADDAGRLDRSEGVPRAYQRVDVALEIDGDAPLGAYTLASQRGQDGRMPSRRYMGLLLHGARYHALPASYIDELRAIPLAVDEREAQAELFEAQPAAAGATSGERDHER